MPVALFMISTHVCLNVFIASLMLSGAELGVNHSFLTVLTPHDEYCFQCRPLVGCWSFASFQYLRSYQDGYWLVTVRTHGDFIVLAHWEIRPPTRWPDIPLSHYPDSEITSICTTLLMQSTRLGSDKYQIYKPLVWLDREPNSPSPAREARALPVLPASRSVGQLK